jgi:SH2 domain
LIVFIAIVIAPTSGVCLQNADPSANKSGFVSRLIVHPSFINGDRKSAEAFLADKPVYEAVFRPARSGVSHLTMTWKVDDGIYVHIGACPCAQRCRKARHCCLRPHLYLTDISEEDKPPGPDGDLMLGRKLRIGDHTFEDLDEVYGRYCLPISSLMEDLKSSPYNPFCCIVLQSHFCYRVVIWGDRKFVDVEDGKEMTTTELKDNVKMKLLQMKRSRPGAVPYIVTKQCAVLFGWRWLCFMWLFPHFQLENPRLLLLGLVDELEGSG